MFQCRKRQEVVATYVEYVKGDEGNSFNAVNGKKSLQRHLRRRKARRHRSFNAVNGKKSLQPAGEWVHVPGAMSFQCRKRQEVVATPSNHEVLAAFYAMFQCRKRQEVVATTQ